MTSHRTTAQRKQDGAALVVSLVILLVMTLIGITAMRSSTLEEKMAGNAQQDQIAFQLAQSALRQGEGWVMGSSGSGLSTSLALGDFYQKGSLCPSSATPPCDLWQPADLPASLDTQNSSWWTTNGRKYTDSLTVNGTTYDAYYVIEHLTDRMDISNPGNPPEYSLFRIVAVAGPAGNVSGPVEVAATVERMWP